MINESGGFWGSNNADVGIDAHIESATFSNDLLCDFSTTDSSSVFTVAEFIDGGMTVREISRKEYFIEEIKLQPFFT